MNKLLRMCAAAILLALMLSSCAAGDRGATVQQPKPTEQTGERAENISGRRFDFTLPEYSEKVNTILADLSKDSDDPPALGEWEVLDAGLSDDNGVSYTSYYSRNKLWTLTAAAESDSAKLMNIGCGCSRELVDGSEYRGSYVTFTAILATVAGGFGEEDIPYFKVMLDRLIDSKYNEFYYEKCLYTLSEDDKTLMIIISPSTPAYAGEHSVKVYDVNDKW